MLENKHEIHGRIYRFVLKTLSAVRVFPRSIENLVLVKQLIRSASSIGANATEADGAESRKEFIQQFIIAKKEAKETYYWLSLLADHNSKEKIEIAPLLLEIQELIAIISKIVLNAKQNK